MSALEGTRSETASPDHRRSAVPPVPSSASRSPSSPFSMRLSAAERNFLTERSGGKPWACYIRERVFGDGANTTRRSVRRPRIEDAELAAALSGLGHSRLSSNLNQLAKAVNMGSLDVEEDVQQQLKDACDAIQAMRDALIMALGLSR